MGASPQHGCSTIQAVLLIEELSKRRTSDLGTHKPLLFPTVRQLLDVLGGASLGSGPAGGSAAEVYRELPFWASCFNGITYTLDLWLWSQLERCVEGYAPVWEWASHLSRRNLNTLGKLPGEAREMTSWFSQALRPFKEQRLSETRSFDQRLDPKDSPFGKQGSERGLVKFILEPSLTLTLPPSSKPARVLPSQQARLQGRV